MLSERAKDREVGKQQDKNKPYTFPLFSPFKTQIKLVLLSLFLLHQRFSPPLSSQRAKNIDVYIFFKKWKSGYEMRER